MSETTTSTTDCCRNCRLPVGQNSYYLNGRGPYHYECFAHPMPVAGTPKEYRSLHKKINEVRAAAGKSEKIIREQQLEIDRLKQKLAEAQSSGASS